MTAKSETSMSVANSKPALTRQVVARIGLGLAAAAGSLVAGLLLLQSWGEGEAGLLIAPFGASCVLLFAAPQSPFARYRNVVLGYVVSTLCGLLATALPDFHGATAVLAMACAVGLMAALDVVHPPAGAMPVLVVASASPWSFLINPTLAGVLVLLAVAWFYRQLPRLFAYFASTGGVPPETFPSETFPSETVPSETKGVGQ